MTRSDLVEILAAPAGRRPPGETPATRLEIERLADHWEERLEAARFFFPPDKAASMRLAVPASPAGAALGSRATHQAMTSSIPTRDSRPGRMPARNSCAIEVSVKMP